MNERIIALSAFLVAVCCSYQHDQVLLSWLDFSIISKPIALAVFLLLT